MKRSAIRGAAWAATQRAGTHLVNFLVLLILSRLLTPADIGLVALATTFVSAGQVVLDLGLGQALIQRRTYTDLDADTVFWVAMGSGIILSIALAAGASLVSTLFKVPDMAAILRWSSISLMLLGLNATQKALLQRDLAFGRLAARTLSAELAGGVVGIALAATGFGVWSLVVRNVVRDITGVIVLWRVSSWRPRLRASVATLREMRPFGAAVIGTRALDFLNQSADQLLIGLFAGPTILGYYVVALRVLRVIRQFLVESIAAVAFPFFSRLQDDHVRLRRSFLAGIRFANLAAFPAFLGTALVAPDLIAVLLGSAWTASIPVLQIMALLGLVQSVGFFPSAILLAMGRPVWRFGLNMVNSFANVGVILWAMPHGLAAVAAAQVVRAYLLFPLSLHAARVTLGVRWRGYLRASIPAAVGSVAMVVAVALIRQVVSAQDQAWIRLGLSVGVGAAAYLITLRIAAPKSLREAAELARSVVARSSSPPDDAAAA